MGMAASEGPKIVLQNVASDPKPTSQPQQQGIQFPKQKKKKKKVNPGTTPQAVLPTQPAQPRPDGTKKKKKKKKAKPVEVVQAPPSAKKRVSFSPGIVSTVNFTYSKQEYDRTPIMGIFNHFCDCCQSSIEGARFHCQLCPDFDMCQTCFVTQGERHIHGQQAFSCPELDELEALDEGDEDEGEDIDFFKQFFTSSIAEGEGDEAMFGGFGGEGDDAFEELGGEGDEGDEPSGVVLEDENGPLEQISPEEAAKRPDDAKEPESLKDLFPKLPASSQPSEKKTSQPSQASKGKQPSKASQSAPSSKPSQPSQPSSNPSSESSTKTKKRKKKKTKEQATNSTQSTSPQKQSPKQPAKSGPATSPTSGNKKQKQANGTAPPKAAVGKSPSPSKPKAQSPQSSKKRPRGEESNSTKQKIQRLEGQ